MVSNFFSIVLFYMFSIFFLVRLRWVRTVPAMTEMPDGWPHIGLSSGLDAVHMYPDCEFLFLSFQFRFLLFLVLVYKTHKLKDRDSFGQSDGK